MNNQDTPYWITAFLKEASKTVESKICEREIAVNGYFLVKSGPHTAKIYTAELYGFDLSRVDGRASGFEEPCRTEQPRIPQDLHRGIHGRRRVFRRQLHSVSEVLYGANQKQYIQDLHNHYFHIQHHPGKKGWNYVRHQHPFILTHEAVKTFGYYSGLVSKVDELVERHPLLFATFNECSGDESPGNAESHPTDLRQKIEKHFAFFAQCLRKHKTILSDDD